MAQVVADGRRVAASGDGAWIEHRFRPDVEGLRAVAIAAVVLYHAELTTFAGGFVGVDVFFVVSGFLITSLLLRDREEHGRIRLAPFWARRIRRLLPASVLVLVATSVLARFVMSALSYVRGLADVPWAGLYISNVLFAQEALDYLGPGQPSFVLHYWSLAVEEQFYVVWPVLLLLAGRGGRRAIVATVAAVAVASFAANVVLTDVRQPWAFFLLPARAWELALGALVAMAGPLLARLARGVREAMAWIGLGAIAYAVFAFDHTTLFPGVAATVPVAGTALVIASGAATQHVTTAARLLSLRPAVLLGRWSYSLYLWHWPLLVMAAGDGTSIAPRPVRLGAVAASIGLAALTHRYVEVPLRSSPWLSLAPRRCAALAVALTAVAVLAGTLPGAPVMHSGRPSEGDRTDWVASDLRPSLRGASRDLPALYDLGCHDEKVATLPTACAFGDRDSDRTVVLFGDSHAAQWFPALEAAAIDEGWRLVTFTKSACPSVDIAVVNADLGRTYTECATWRAAVHEEIQQEQPELVVLSNSRGYRREGGGDLQDAWGAGLRDTIERLAVDAVVLGDTPRPGYDVPVCLSAHVDDVRPCEFSVAEGVDDEHETVEASVADATGARFVRTAGWICHDARCPVIDGDVLLWRDRHHITATFAATLTERVADEVLR